MNIYKVDLVSNTDGHPLHDGWLVKADSEKQAKEKVESMIEFNHGVHYSLRTTLITFDEEGVFIPLWSKQ